MSVIIGYLFILIAFGLAIYLIIDHIKSKKIKEEEDGLHGNGANMQDTPRKDVSETDTEQED